MVKVSTLFAGLVTGGWVAVAQAFVGVSPPSVYGICSVNHPRDLLDWVINRLFGTNFFVHAVSLEFPVLTAVGLLAGSFVAAAQHNEVHFRAPRQAFSMFTYGFLVANFGLLLGYCSVHVVMAAAYGDLLAVTGLAFMVFGVIVAVEFVKWRVRT